MGEKAPVETRASHFPVLPLRVPVFAQLLQRLLYDLSYNIRIKPIFDISITKTGIRNPD